MQRHRSVQEHVLAELPFPGRAVGFHCDIIYAHYGSAHTHIKSYWYSNVESRPDISHECSQTQINMLYQKVAIRYEFSRGSYGTNVRTLSTYTNDHCKSNFFINQRKVMYHFLYNVCHLSLTKNCLFRFCGCGLGLFKQAYDHPLSFLPETSSP